MSAIRRDPKRQELQDSPLRIKLKFEHLTAIKEAFHQRVSMLMSLGANLREEYQATDIHVLEKEYADKKRGRNRRV